MDITTAVTMDKTAAEKAFREYRAAYMAERNRIDGELMRGYKALADGKTLISLRETITKGGADDIGRPRLAIARADERAVEMALTVNGRVTFSPVTRARTTDRVFNLPDGTLPHPPKTREDWWLEPWAGLWQANLPFIPPPYRPPHGLVNYHLLWEAEWHRAPRAQRLDPMLLKRIGGDLFAVVAAWDLTPLEKLILAR